MLMVIFIKIYLGFAYKDLGFQGAQKLKPRLMKYAVIFGP